MTNRSRHHLKPGDELAYLADWYLLEDITRSALAVYLRLLKATREQRSCEVFAFNSKLHRNPRTAAVALRELEGHKLVSTKVDATGRRIITVLQ